MEIRVKVGEPERELSEALVIGVYEGEELEERVIALDRALAGRIKEILSAGDFKGKPNQLHILYTEGKIGAKRVLLVGLGKRADISLEKVRQVAGRALCHLRDLGITTAHFLLLGIGRSGITERLSAQAIIEGGLLGLYRFILYKTDNEDKKKETREIVILLGKGEDLGEAAVGAQVGKAIAEATNFTRDMVNQPSNDMTPTKLAEIAQDLARRHNLSCKVLDKDEIVRTGMGAFYGVSKGSQEPPKFIILEYKKKEQMPPIILVGKSITFDSGGISIKPSEGMERMKYDMAGGAIALGVIKALAEMDLPLNVIALLPATENLPSGSALKPGDILHSLSGKTIEIISTDAEGRLALADALAYAKRYNPSAIIDIATLTRACVIALGNNAIGMMGNDDNLKLRIKEAGEATSEKVWELPLWDEYKEQIKSDVADIKNTGGQPAGVITAGMFLKEFVEGTHWVHLDIAGLAWNDKEKPYIPKGASGVGVRLLTKFLMDWHEGR